MQPLLAARPWPPRSRSGAPSARRRRPGARSKGAAQSLPHRCEHRLGSQGDHDQAIEWHYRAGVAFQNAGQREDAQAVIRHLESLAGKYPTALPLVAKLDKLVAGEA